MRENTMSITRSIIHPASGINLSAPGGVQALLDFHRCTFGDAVMEDNSGAGGSSGTGGDPGAGTGGQGTGSDSGATGGQQGGAPGSSGQEGQDGEKLGEGGIKALQAERDARTQAQKDLTAAQNRIKELENATKTEEQKRTERLGELEQNDRTKDTKIAGLESTLLRYQVAAAEGLDLEAAERLRGATKEEIEADAKAFKAKFGPNRPGVVPGAGARGTDNPQVSPGVGRLAQAYASTSN
jgi:hypothetical protein